MAIPGSELTEKEVHVRVKIWGDATHIRNYCGWPECNILYKLMRSNIIIPLSSDEATLRQTYKDIIDRVQLALDEYPLLDDAKGRDCVSIIGLLYAEKFTPTDIARKTGISRRTVYNLKRRIFRWLQKALS